MMADFPASLVPSVTQGYGFDSPANVLTQSVQGGVPLMMLDYASGPVTFNIGLVMTPSDLQTFQEFIVNDIDNGAGEFNINIDSGYGVSTHNVVIDMDSLNIDGSRAPIWTASFTVIKWLDSGDSFMGFNAAESSTDSGINPDNKSVTSVFNGYKTAVANNNLVRDTYWESTASVFGASDITPLGIIPEGFDVDGGVFLGFEAETYGLFANFTPDQIWNSNAGAATGIDSLSGQVISYRYTESTRLIEASTNAIAWVSIMIVPAGLHKLAVGTVLVGQQISVAFIHEDCIRTIPAGYSTYDNDHTAL